MKKFDLSLFLKKLIEVIGVTSGIVTILLAFWSEFPNKVKGNELLYFSLLILFDIIIAILRSLPRNNIQLKITETINCNIFFGDLFKQEEIIVIPVNEYFDTIVDDRIISSKTLHGIFVKNIFGGDEENLKNQIKKSLIGIEPIETNNKKEGNTHKYELGTVAKVEKSGKTYYLVALTRFNENNRAEITKKEYQEVIHSLFDYAHQYSQGKKLSIPLIGGGHSGIKLSKQNILEFLLFSLQLNDDLTFTGDINIILYNSIKKDINLNKLEYFYNVRGK